MSAKCQSGHSPSPALALRLGSRDEFLDYGAALAYSASAVFFQSAFGNAI